MQDYNPGLVVSKYFADDCSTTPLLIVSYWDSESDSLVIPQCGSKALFNVDPPHLFRLCVAQFLFLGLDSVVK